MLKRYQYHDFLRASRVKSGIWHMFCISKPRADMGKLVLFLESAGQVYPETCLTFEAPKCVLASVIPLDITNRMVVELRRSFSFYDAHTAYLNTPYY
jgi:hypothetical protein